MERKVRNYWKYPFVMTVGPRGYKSIMEWEEKRVIKEKLEKILKKEETYDKKAPFRTLPVGHEYWYSKKAQAILNKLPELGLVRLEDVCIDKAKLLSLWAKLWGYGELGLMEYKEKHFKVVIDFETLAKAITEAKGILRVKEE